MPLDYFLAGLCPSLWRASHVAALVSGDSVRDHHITIARQICAPPGADLDDMHSARRLDLLQSANQRMMRRLAWPRHDKCAQRGHSEHVAGPQLFQQIRPIFRAPLADLAAVHDDQVG
jgi:hypothetical protein